jgi:ubiquinone/menaquinone biosynthesis C-methylase UbiE
MTKTPAFTKFARDYSAGNEDPLKRLFGENLDQFIYVKAKWLWNYLRKSQYKILLNERYHLLDYGCGTGEMLNWLKLFGFPGYLYGADVSQSMLDEAEKRWGTTTQKPLFSCIGETITDFADNSFSCITATCVFHHIEPDNRDNVLREIKRILAPGGLLVVFEHNPFNPMTQLIVKRSVVDKDAILLHPSEIRDRFTDAAFVDFLLEYLMFFPPRIRMLNSLEEYLSWCPLGAQYAAVGRKQHYSASTIRINLKA